MVVSKYIRISSLIYSVSVVGVSICAEMGVKLMILTNIIMAYPNDNIDAIQQIILIRFMFLFLVFIFFYLINNLSIIAHFAQKVNSTYAI